MKVLISDPLDQEARDLLSKNKIDFDYFPEIQAPDLISTIDKYSALLVRSRTKVTLEVIERGINLKVVGRIGSGFDNIDIDACKKKSITVVNAPDANSQSVAEFTIGLITAFLRQVPRAVSSMRSGLWIKNEIWGGEIQGKKIAVLGYGFVGKKVVTLLKAYKASISVWSRSYKTASLDKIFAQSDIISIHLALNQETRGLINNKLLSKMKQSSLLLNLARGELVDEEALYNLLKEKKIAGAILDVYWQEPLPADSRWRKLDNVLLTPHIGAATAEALKRASNTTVNDIIRVLHGKKALNRVI